MEIKSRVVQLCIDMSTWSMVIILGLGCIQVKGEIVRIETRIRCEGRQSFRDQNQTCTRSYAQDKLTYTLYS